MDRICGAVLDKINGLSPAGRYVIIAEEEFNECFPEGDDNGEQLDKVLTKLKEGGYIDVRYSRGDLYCIAPLKEFIEEDEPPEETEAEAPRRKFNFTFASAFLGGMLGSLVISLIFALV